MKIINRYHIYFWVSFFGFFMLLDYLQYPEYFYIGRQLYIPVVQLSIFYSFSYIITFFKADSLRAWAKFIGLLILSFGLIVFLNYWRGKIAEYYGVIMHGSVDKLLYDTVRQYCGLAFYVIGYYYINRSKHKEKQLRQLAEQQAAKDIAAAQLAAHNAQLAANNAQLAASNAQMRQEVLELENNFLRAQINPHFLYNTLNTFYAKALPLSQELADAIITLAGIMRYSLQMEQHGQLTALKMEVAHLERVITMHRMRFGNKCHINFTIEGPCEQYKVVPLIFITLLENAIKYGVVDDPVDPVTLQLSVKGPYIQFFIRNKKMGKPPQPSHGIGLHNIRKRLTHVYGTQYQLNINDTATHYQVLLDIEYKESENIEP